MRGTKKNMTNSRSQDDDPKLAAGSQQNRFCDDVSRRKFLKTAAALGAGVMAAGNALVAQTESQGSLAKTGRIDVHHHAVVPGYMKASGLGANWHWSPAVSLEQMDKYAIATAMLSISTPGVWYGNVEQGRQLARECNEFMANMMRDYAGRFGMFTAVPLPDQDGTLAEIEYGYDKLKADGVGLLTSYGDKWLGDPAFEPAFQELNRRNAIVFIHVTGPSCCSNLIPGARATMDEYDFDMTRTVVSMLVNGTFAKFPNVRFILVHSGGTLPVLAGRINDRFPKDRLSGVPDGVLPTLKKLYYEVAHATYPSPLSALTQFAPMPQILFGTDYPAEVMTSTIDPLAHFGLSAQDLQAINRGNAEQLFPRLRTSPAALSTR